MTKPTIEDLFAEISERGWKVNNLFQIRDGLWQANLSDGTYYTEFAVELTPVEALTVTMDKLKRGNIHKHPETTITSSIAPPVDIVSFLKLRPTVKRRF